MLTLSEGKDPNWAKVVAETAMEIHLFTKKRKDAPVHFAVQKYATSRSNVMKAS